MEDYGGFVQAYMGDGICALFGFPRAHEDDAERAAHLAASHHGQGRTSPPLLGDRCYRTWQAPRVEGPRLRGRKAMASRPWPGWPLPSALARLATSMASRRE
ncbi:MAG: hypothetical protein E6G47_13850 [Actinobacteria bacterium]|nr:MAG: hypothetical protein E6G47_13850 [Actinomycetota bacterium]